MIAPLKSISELNISVTKTYSNLTFISICLGILLSSSFSIIWTELANVPRLALWPLGFAFSFVTVSLIASRRLGKLRWDLLIWGQLFGIIGAALFFFAAI